MTAPEDDESWTAQDDAAIAEADADLAAGRMTSLEDVERKHGIE